MSIQIKAKSTREDRSDLDKGGSHHGLSKKHEALMIAKAVRAAFTTYFKEANDFLTNDGEYTPDVTKIQQWINGQNIEPEFQSGSSQDVPAVIAAHLTAFNHVTGVPGEIDEVGFWLINANKNETPGLGGSAEYEVTITFDDKAFKAYALNKKLYKQSKITPLLENVSEWWSQPLNAPWLSEELVGSTSFSGIQLFYNVAILAVNPDDGGTITSIKDFTDDQFDEIKEQAKAEGHQIIIRAFGKETKEEESTSEISEIPSYSSWSTEAHIPGSSLGEWMHMRVVPKPPHTPESINYAIVRVQVAKSIIDKLQVPHESIEKLGDLPGVETIARVEFYSAKNLQKDLNFLCGQESGEEQGTLYYYAERIKLSNYRFLPDLDLITIGDLIKTFYDNFIRHLHLGPENFRVDTKEVFHKDSGYAFEFIFDNLYNIISIKLLKPKKGESFNFAGGSTNNGIIQNIGATKIVYIRKASGKSKADELKIDVARKAAAGQVGGSPSKFQDIEVMQTQECMFLLYNLRKIVYQSEGFLKNSARQTSWREFVDQYIHPPRAYKKELPKEKNPERENKIIVDSNIPVATRKTMNEQVNRSTKLEYKKDYLEHRKDSKDNIDDLYTTKEIKEEQNVTTIESSYKKSLNRKDIRTYASKAVQYLWPNPNKDITEILFEAAVDRVDANQIIDKLSKTEYPPDSGSTIFEYINNTDSDSKLSNIIKALANSFSYQKKKMEDFLDERRELQTKYDEQSLKYEELRIEYEELLFFEEFSEQEINEADSDAIQELKDELDNIMGTKDDASNTNSLLYLEGQLKNLTSEQIAAEVAYSKNVGSSIVIEAIVPELKASLKNEEAQLAKTISKSIISLVPGYSKVIHNSPSETENFSYDKFIKNLTPKKLTIPDIPRIPTDDIMPTLYAELKKMALEVATAAITNELSKLIKNITNYRDGGKTKHIDALGYGSENSTQGTKNLNEMITDTARKEQRVRKAFSDFGIGTYDPFMPSPTTQTEFVEDFGWAHGQKVHYPPSSAMFEKFIDDVSSVLTPKELCMLTSGKPSLEILTYIERIIDVGYPEIKLALDTKTKIKAIFKKLGTFLPKNLCNEIQRGLSEINIKYEEICPPDDPKINYRQALIENRLTEEQNQEFLNAIAEARKDAFINALNVATSDPDTYFDNLYKRSGEPGQEECTDPLTGAPYPRLENSGATATMYAKFTSPRTEAEEYLTDLVRDTVFAPITRTFSSDVQNFFNLLLPAIPSQPGSEEEAKAQTKSFSIKEATGEDAAAGLQPVVMPKYNKFLYGFAQASAEAASLAAASIPGAKQGAQSTTWAQLATHGIRITMPAEIYDNSWDFSKNTYYQYLVPYAKDYDNAQLLSNFNGLSPFRLSRYVNINGVWKPYIGLENVGGNFTDYITPAPDTKEWNSSELTDLEKHTWQGHRFKEMTHPHTWSTPVEGGGFGGPQLSITNANSKIISAYLEQRLFTHTTQGLFGLVFQDFNKSYIWEIKKIKRLFKIIRDSLMEAVGNNCSVCDVDKNILEMEKIKNRAKKKQNSLECDAPQGPVLGPGPFEVGNLESTAMLLVRIYAIEIALGSIVPHSRFKMQQLLQEDGAEGILVEYLTQQALSDLNFYRNEQMQLAKKSLNTSSFPEDLLLAIHNLMIDRKKSEGKFLNPVTGNEYEYESFELGGEGDVDVEVNKKLPNKYAAASGWIGVPEFKYEKKTKVSDAQLKAEFKHVLWEQTMSVFESLSNHYMISEREDIDDWFLDKISWKSHGDFFDRLPTTDRESSEDASAITALFAAIAGGIGSWAAQGYEKYYLNSLAHVPQAIWQDLMNLGSGGIWTHAAASEAWGVKDKQMTWGGNTYSEASPFLLGWATESLFGNVVDRPSRTGFYLQPYLKVDWNQNWRDKNGDHPLVEYMEGDGSQDGHFGHVNLKKWQSFLQEHLKVQTMTNYPSLELSPGDGHKKYFNLAWGLRIVIVTEPGSILEATDPDTFKAFDSIVEEVKAKKTNTKAYAHDILKVVEEKHGDKVDNLFQHVFSIKEDFIFSIPLVDVQIPIENNIKLSTFAKNSTGNYPQNALKEKMKEDPKYRIIFRKIFNLPQIVSCASVIGHNILTTTPGYATTFRNTKSGLKSLFYTMRNAHDYKNESDGLKVAHTYSDPQFGGDVMNVGGLMPVDVSKMVRMAQHTILEAIADLIEPSWDWTCFFGFGTYTIPGMLGCISDSLKPGWFDDEKLNKQLRSKKRKKGTKPAENITTQEQCPDVYGKPGFKRVGDS